MSFLSNLANYFISLSQLSKYITHNEGILFLGARGGGVVLSMSETDPPSSPSNGDAYIVASPATGVWAGKEDYIAIYYDGWRFIEPTPGPPVRVDDAGLYVGYEDGSPAGWEVLTIGSGVTNFTQLGDVPGSYSEQAGKGVRVNSGATGLEFYDVVGKHAVPITAGAMRPSVTSGCAALAGVEISAGQPDVVTLDFDNGTQEYAQFSIRMPESWNEGTVTFRPIWSHAATTTNFGVVWSLQGVAVGDDDAIGAAFGTAQTSTDTGGTTNDLYIGPESAAITIAGSPAAGDVVFFRISRVTGDGSDNMAVDARLHGLVLFMTTDAVTDA